LPQGAGQYGYSPRRKCALQPFVLGTKQRKGPRYLVRAADDESSSDSALVLDVKKIGVIPFTKDLESFMDVMAFTGPAPEVKLGLCPFTCGIFLW